VTHIIILFRKKEENYTLKLVVHIAVTAPAGVKYCPPHRDLGSSLSIYFVEYNFMNSQFCKCEVTNTPCLILLHLMALKISDDKFKI
jgi:hypothetical protein